MTHRHGFPRFSARGAARGDGSPRDPWLASSRPASYQPASYQPASYQPASYQPASYQPASYQPDGRTDLHGSSSLFLGDSVRVPS